MATLDELRAKYPYHKIKYVPQLNCDACHGEGEHLNGYKEMSLCICTCVGFSGIGGLFKDFVKKELDALRREIDG